MTSEHQEHQEGEMSSAFMPSGGQGFGHGPEAIGGMQEEDLYRCIHCGLCLDECPTYIELGLETESPRGRIALMRAAYEGRVSPTKQVISHWDLCLGCLACEAVCPSGVPYGRLIEATRTWVATQRSGSLFTRLARRFAFRELLPHPRRLHMVGWLLRLYQRSGLQWLLRRTRVFRLGPGLADAEAALPTLSRTFFQARGQVFPAAGEKRHRVALLAGCVMPLVQAGTMEAAVRVLRLNGCEVVVPQGQVCCGALNLHAGERESARQMAQRNMETFLDAGVDRILVASAGCGAAMKEYGHLFQDDSLLGEQASQFSGMVQDITEFLASLPLKAPTSDLPLRVTYQDSCHLAHAQRVTAPPRALLRSIPGLELVEMSRPDVCCGAAGSYQLLQREMSQRLLDSRIREIAATGAQVIATANPGCMLQLASGVQRAGLNARVCHVVDLLDEAYGCPTPKRTGEGNQGAQTRHA